MAEYVVQVGWTSSSMATVPQAYDAVASTLQKAAREKAALSKVVFLFDFNASVPAIREGMQLWAGWQEGGAWMAGPDPPYMGYLTVSEGGQQGSQHAIWADVSSLNLLFTRATVRGWPTGEADGKPTAGYPPGYSITDWLIGDPAAGKPYPGVIRSYFTNIVYQIDPVFDGIILDATAIPGGNTDALVGQWGATDLDSILQDLVGVARYRAPSVQPVYYFTASAQGSVLRPQFCFADAASTSGSVVGTFSVDPGPGEFGII